TQAERQPVESQKMEEAVVEHVVPLSVVQESAAPTFAPSAPPPAPLQMDVPTAAPAPAKPAESAKAIVRSADVVTRELESMAKEPPPENEAIIVHRAQQQGTAIADDLARKRREEERGAAEA